MATRYQQGNGRKLDAATFQHIGTNVTNQVVDRVDRYVVSNRKTLGSSDANHQRPG